MSRLIVLTLLMSMVGLSPFQSAEPKPGEARKFEIAKDLFMEFCWIPAGEAQLGSTKTERDAVLKHLIDKKANININGVHGTEAPEWLKAEAAEIRGKFKTKGFWLGKYPVTQEEWKAVMKDNPSYFDGKKDNKAKGMNTDRFPVERVNWDDCQIFLKKLNERGGVEKVFGAPGQFALPHEDMWEYACRGDKGNDRPYYWGNSLNGNQSNCDGDNPFGTAKVGQYLERTCAVDFENNGKYEKHPWGLCHMNGNVFQWCSNHLNQAKEPKSVRGGAWSVDAFRCRSASRTGAYSVERWDFFGLRVCIALDK